MELPEDHPGGFAIFVDWIYTNQLNCDECNEPSTSAFKHPTAPYDLDLLALWVFVDKISLNQLAEEVYEKLDNCSGELINLSTDGIRFVYKNTAETSRLRGFLVDVIVRRYFTGTLREGYHVEGKDLGQLAASHATFAGDPLQGIQEHTILDDKDCDLSKCICHKKKAKKPLRIIA